MFKRLDESQPSTVTVVINGRSVIVPQGESVAAAVLAENIGYTRTTPVKQQPRAPFCMMGVCFDCLMIIDGVPNQQACMVQVRDGMRIERQHGSGV
ncbi:MAG: (2Fe-2S)-binding protein [Pseudomonadota bacterium]|nr:(2Fe-2S)-binding protein [Pseudomonadota bacterium]